MKKIISRHKGIARLFVFIVLTMIVTFAGDRYSPDNDWEFWGLIVFAVLVLLPQGLIFPVVRSLGYKNDSSSCLENSTQCCVEFFKDELAEKHRGIITIDENTMKDYHLSRFDDMARIIKMFSSQELDSTQSSFRELIGDDIPVEDLHGVTKEIWYFSYEISVESFLGNVEASKVIEINEVSIVYFYIRNDTSSTSREKAKLKKCYQKAKISFWNIPIEQSPVTNAINVLPEILGSIIFIFRIENGDPCFASYFVLKGKNKESIYFKMPYCMNEDYFMYLHRLSGGSK